MIISPNGLPTINVLHAVNNSYKCTDQVYLYAQSEEDCNLYLQRPYWERDPEDPYLAPNFTLPARTLMLIREDLAGAGAMEGILQGEGTVHVPFSLYNRNGDAMAEEITEFYMTYSSGSLPMLLPAGLNTNTPSNRAFQRFCLTRSYFPPHTLTLQSPQGNYFSNFTTDHLKDLHLPSAIAGRVRFGEERRVCCVLFYRPLNRSGTSDHRLQLLRLPGYTERLEVLFDSSTSPGYQEPPEELCARLSTGSGTYVGGIPCIANLETQVVTKELFFRWTGGLTHFQLLDTPIISPESWTLADNPDMTFHWQYIIDKVPGWEDTDMGIASYEYKGDISTGIRFKHPLGKDENTTNNPYAGLNTYTARCVGSSEGYRDIWKMAGTVFSSFSDTNGINSDWYEENLGERDADGFIQRVVDDNQTYIANKSLLQWYYTPETNSWNSNYTRASTPHQLRLLVTLPSIQMVCGCLNPMSVPATFNRPTFTKLSAHTEYGSGGSGGNAPYTFSPGVYDDYIVPWRVLLEGRRDNKVQTRWELMDEFALEHFSARAHTYFSYPRAVKYLRITIQDWYGNTLMEDMRNDHISNAPGGHYAAYSAVEPHAYNIVCQGHKGNIGTILDDVVSFESAKLRKVWSQWKRYTIQSLWKGIYIPPFLFFGK